MVNLVIRKIRLARVLIDGGSALNIIFAKTLEDMGFDMTKLVPSDQAFYSINPGTGSTPVGTRDNYRTESIIFEVTSFETSYHAILGRPALAKFMAIQNHMYLLLKMLAPNEVLSMASTMLMFSVSQEWDVRMSPQTERTPFGAGIFLRRYV